MSTVIVGTGIIGAATAFYLSQSPSTTAPASIHLVDSSPELFASASGYAAGFLARDWFSRPLAALGALSFDLHKELAEQNNGTEKWGYCRSTGTSLAVAKGKRGDEWLREGTSRAEAAGVHTFEQSDGPAWLARTEGGTVEAISQDDSTAQVFVLSHL
jgi:glycine/D-amino acid oxidase-like deaminating enzyme